MNDPKGFRLAMVILALAWLAIFLALLYAFIRVPEALGDPYAVWSLLASGAAVAGALLTRGFRMIGVVLYIVAAASLIVKTYLIPATGPMPVGWPYILGLLLFVGLVWSEWGRFRRPNAQADRRRPGSRGAGGRHSAAGMRACRQGNTAFLLS